MILSTHIIGAISQSGNDLAVIARGQALFRGSPRELINRARGSVWNVLTDGRRPSSGLAVVSSLQLEGGTQYRVLGTPAEAEHAQPVEPSLGDGYMWFMRAAQA